MDNKIHLRRFLILIGISIIPLLLILLLRKTEEIRTPDAKPVISRRAQASLSSSTDHSRPQRWLAAEEWKRELEGIFGEHEAKRSRILTRKETVDSEIYLLAVEPPTAGEIAKVRERIGRLASRIDPAKRAAFDAQMQAAEADYDPYGNEGPRVIQIDVPDEPNGRLTGFTCHAGNFSEITEKFEKGEMADLRNLRGYAATYAGMPLTRFDALIVMEE